MEKAIEGLSGLQRDTVIRLLKACREIREIVQKRKEMHLYLALQVAVFLLGAWMRSRFRLEFDREEYVVFWLDGTIIFTAICAFSYFIKGRMKAVELYKEVSKSARSKAAMRWLIERDPGIEKDLKRFLENKDNV